MVIPISLLWLLLVIVEGLPISMAFYGNFNGCRSSSSPSLSSSTFVSRRPLRAVQPFHHWRTKNPCLSRHRQNSKRMFLMRDASASYWFQIGDSVRVVADNVVKGGINLHDRRGTVVETWEKCDVDPTCCCAEQVDPNMAVRVEFAATAERDADRFTLEGTTTTTSSSILLPPSSSPSFFHYFAEDELVKVNEEEKVQQDEKENLVPFDGMSCTAFKLERLQSSVSKQPRGIAKWEPIARPQQQHSTEGNGH